MFIARVNDIIENAMYRFILQHAQNSPLHISSKVYFDKNGLDSKYKTKVFKLF